MQVWVVPLLSFSVRMEKFVIFVQNFLFVSVYLFLMNSRRFVGTSCVPFGSSNSATQNESSSQSGWLSSRTLREARTVLTGAICLNSDTDGNMVGREAPEEGRSNAGGAHTTDSVACCQPCSCCTDGNMVNWETRVGGVSITGCNLWLWCNTGDSTENWGWLRWVSEWCHGRLGPLMYVVILRLCDTCGLGQGQRTVIREQSDRWFVNIGESYCFSTNHVIGQEAIINPSYKYLQKHD